MKNLLLTILTISSMMFAQASKVDSTDNATSKDSVDIRELVRQQIEAAKEKPSVNAAEFITVPEDQLGVPKKEESTVGENKILIVIKNMPLHIKLFFLLSAVILSVLVFRRFLLLFGKRTAQSFKDKIALLREEKIGSKENPKLKVSREQLKNSRLIYDGTDKEISKAAKELKIAKGEFLLAARLKLFEVGKI
jgi:hypothetical protein